MSSGTGTPTGMPSGTANGFASRPASQGTSTPAATDIGPATPAGEPTAAAAAAAPAANAQPAAPEARRPAPTYGQLVALLSASRARRSAAEQEAAQLRAANADLDRQLQAHSQATVRATESIALLNEQVQALTRVNSTVTQQLIATQRELIDLQQELVVELRERLSAYEGGEESEDENGSQ